MNSRLPARYIKHGARVSGLIVLDLLFFGLTDPAKVPSYAVVVGFGLLCATLFYSVRLLQTIGGVYSPWLARQRYLARAVTIVLALLLALQSIGQLSTRDFVLLPLAGLAAYLYVSIIKKAA